jgi:hypothetical protein
MYVTGNDTAAPPVGVSPPPLWRTSRRAMRRRVEYGGARSAETRAVLGRLEDEREIWQQGRLTRRRSGVGSFCTRATSSTAGACLG